MSGRRRIPRPGLMSEAKLPRGATPEQKRPDVCSRCSEPTEGARYICKRCKLALTVAAKQRWPEDKQRARREYNRLWMALYRSKASGH